MNALETTMFVLGSATPSLLIAWGALFFIRRWAPSWGLIDQPNSRKVHTAPIPLGGGLGIWLGVIGAFAIGQTILWVAAIYYDESGAEHWSGAPFPEWVRPHLDGLWARRGNLWVLLAGATVLAGLGLADDRRGLHWSVRLMAQFAVAAACVAWQGWKLTVFLQLPWLTGAISVLWIVAMINSFNMLDNMDGLSGGVAALAAAILTAVVLMFRHPQTAQPAPQWFVGGFLLVLVGALVGFLLHNRPPARIFMGDAGSYFVGFCIAASTLLATYAGYHSDRRHAILAPVCVMAVPLYDMLTVLWIRLRQGNSPFHADKNHFSHRLVELGFTKPQAVLTIYLLTATCGMGALLLQRVDVIGAAIIMVMILCVLCLIALLESTARRKLKQ